MTHDEEIQYYRNLSHATFSKAQDLYDKSDEYWQMAEFLHAFEHGTEV